MTKSTAQTEYLVTSCSQPEQAGEVTSSHKLKIVNSWKILKLMTGEVSKLLQISYSVTTEVEVATMTTAINVNGL